MNSFPTSPLATRQLTAEEMNKILAEKVPEDLRLRSVYIPIILLDTLFIYINPFLDELKNFKANSTKPISRGINNCIREYNNTNYRVMGRRLYDALKQFSGNLIAQFNNPICVTQCSYYQAVLDASADNTDMYLKRALSWCYTCKSIIRYIMRYENECTRAMQEKLGDRVTLQVTDNTTCTAMMNFLNQFTDLFKRPRDIYSTNVALSYQVFANTVNQIDVTDI